MKVSKNDIYGIKAGTQKSFVMEDYQSLISARQYAYQLSKYSDRPSNVARYRSSVDGLVLTIKAEKR